MQRKDQSNLAVASMVLGIISLVAWILPICGGPVAIVGLVLGIIAWNSAQHNKAVVGVVMCAISLVATIINAGAGTIMFM
ncbi:MAG: hypothetical protein JXA21_07390 [Anaerolineae bacterium]|nr:hypothetical protein [Anaerolineae bacterium]